MKESLQGINKKPIFKWTFESEQTALKNGWENTGATFNNGVGSFNGNSYLTSKLNVVNGVYSIRIKCNVTNFAQYRQIIDFRGTNLNGSIYVRTAITTGAIQVFAGTTYVNGVQTSAMTAEVDNEIVITGLSIKSGTGTFANSIGAVVDFSNKFLGTIELIELYQGTLTAQEVVNLKNNSFCTQPKLNEILNIDGKNGTISNKYGTVIANTAVTSVRQGDVNVLEFNGTSSGLDCGSYDTLVGDKTFILWVKPRSYGESNGGRIFDNGKFQLMTTSTGYLCRSDAATEAYSSAIPLWKKHLLVVTRTAAGVVNFYVNGVLYGTANQNSGTPVAGTSSLKIGSLSTVRFFDGTMSGIRVVNGILSTAEISQLHSSERKFYNI